ADDLQLVDGGSWELHYQKRVIDSAIWVHDPVWDENINVAEESKKGFLYAPGITISIISALGAVLVVEGRKNVNSTKQIGPLPEK
ncbi:MAG: hypothetical protein QF566_01740, partial [Candidatus Thalassarchaeaceae archaeon]|nr:hypothetical protein [Candidatus Thalassarchaeaceae archaeon]